MAKLIVEPDGIVFDLETSGLSVERGEIIAIHAVKVTDNGASTQRVSALVKPARPISSQVEKITGITNAMLDNQPTFPEVARAFIDFIGNDQLFTVKAVFDQRFLDHQLAIAGLPVVSAERIVDMLPYIPKQFRGRGVKGIVEAGGVSASESEGLSINVLEGIYRKFLRV